MQGRWHYAWTIAGVTFIVLLMTAGVRATPGLFIVPLESEFGWSTATISAAIAVNIALFGLVGPFAASLMDRWGLRRVVLCALALMTTAVALSAQMSSQWQFFLLWGVLVGMTTGVTSLVFGAVVATHWFDQHRGLVMGMLSAANATGQLIFLPLLAKVVEASSWRSATSVVAGAAAAVFVLVFVLMRGRPSDLGLTPYGHDPQAANSVRATAMRPLAALAHAIRTPAFWLLAGTFFICGASTNGLIGTHLISACHDVGIPATRSTQLLAMMGVFDILGTTASGWLTDRYSARRLLFAYYSLRGLSLLFLPATLLDGGASLAVFAVFYGLDWVATVPATVKLTTDAFGRENTARCLRVDRRESSAGCIAGGIRRRSDSDDVGRLSARLSDRRRALPARRGSVHRRRPLGAATETDRYADRCPHVFIGRDLVESLHPAASTAPRLRRHSLGFELK